MQRPNSALGSAPPSTASRVRPVRLLAPIAVLLVFLAVKTFAVPLYEVLVREDGLVENLQFVLYMLAGWMAFLCVRGLAEGRARLLAVSFVGIGAALLVVGLEEISWGERLLGFNGPSWIVERNAQSETSLHNLRPVHDRLNQAYILIGSLGFLVPLLVRSFHRARLGLTANLLVPERSLVFWFLPVAVIYGLFEYGWSLFPVAAGEIPFRGQYFVIWRDQEPAELLLAAGLLLFMLDARRKIPVLVREVVRPRVQPAIVAADRSGDAAPDRAADGSPR